MGFDREQFQREIEQIRETVFHNAIASGLSVEEAVTIAKESENEVKDEISGLVQEAKEIQRPVREDVIEKTSLEVTESPIIAEEQTKQYVNVGNKEKTLDGFRKNLSSECNELIQGGALILNNPKTAIIVIGEIALDSINDIRQDVGIQAFFKHLDKVPTAMLSLVREYCSETKKTLKICFNSGMFWSTFREVAVDELAVIGNTIYENPIEGTALTAYRLLGIASITKSALPAKRLKWQQSESYIEHNFGSKARKQVSYLSGNEVPTYTKYSVRPDAIVGFNSIEVKNYKLPNNSKQMIRSIVKQSQKRYTHLPNGMEQRIKIDITGQNVSKMEINKIKEKIVSKSSGIIKYENIDFFRQGKSVLPLSACFSMTSRELDE